MFQVIHFVYNSVYVPSSNTGYASSRVSVHVPSLVTGYPSSTVPFIFLQRLQDSLCLILSLFFLWLGDTLCLWFRLFSSFGFEILFVYGSVYVPTSVTGYTSLRFRLCSFFSYRIRFVYGSFYVPPLVTRYTSSTVSFMIPSLFRGETGPPGGQRGCFGANWGLMGSDPKI